jgi:hypothetical protein
MNIETVREICKESGLPFEYNNEEIIIKSDLFNNDWDYFFCMEDKKQISVFCIIQPGFNDRYETWLNDSKTFRYDIDGDEIVGLTEEKLKFYLQLLKQNLMATLEKRALKQMEKDFV